MAYVKGSIGRRIKAPGYHIKPKYDLKKLRAKLYGHGNKNTEESLPLTAMVDMFSVLIIFLIMNFSATGEIFFISKNLKLPTAGHANPLESLPLISITKDAVILEAEKLSDNPVYLEEKDETLPRLKMKLEQIRILETTIHPDQPFKGEVNIQADINTPIVYVKRVMNTLISEGWTGINFAVQGTDSSYGHGNSQEKSQEQE